MEEQLAEARAALGQATDSSRKLAEEKASLEESLKKADLPGEDETEDMVVLRHADLVDRIGELEGSLVEDSFPFVLSRFAGLGNRALGFIRLKETSFSSFDVSVQRGDDAIFSMVFQL